MSVLIDIFPIDFDLETYPLTAFQIDAENAVEVGGTFAARVRKLRNIPCAWIREEELLVSSDRFTQDVANSVLEELWSMKLEGFDTVTGVKQITDWQPSPEALAGLFVHGILENARDDLKKAFSKESITIKTVEIERSAEIQPILVHGEPAIQIMLHSPMGTKQKLSSFYNPNDPDGIKDLSVKCRNTKGTVDKIVGPLIEHRNKLKNWKPTDYDPKVLDTLPDDHPIIVVKPYYGKKRYQYPMAVLDITVDMSSLKKLGLSQQQINTVTSRLKIAPDERERLVSLSRNALKDYLQREYPFVTLGERFTSDTHPDSFADAKSLNFDSQLRFGSGVANIDKDTDMLKAIKKHGIFKTANRFSQNNAMRLAVVDTIPGGDHGDARNNQLLRFKKFLKSQGIELARADSQKRILADSPAEQRTKLVNALNNLIQHKPDIILVYLPDSDRIRGDDDELSLYNTTKSVCIEHGMTSQIILENNVGNKWADDNLLMGILGKTGNVPYILAKPIEYADMVVGLDVSREVKRNAPGTINTAAMSRIYLETGELAGYAASGGSIQGEIIPRSVLERILPEEQFHGKRAIVHRDGRFVGEELSNILEWGQNIGADFFPVEVVKSGTPRFYLQHGKTIIQAKKATAFATSNASAYIVSSPPPSRKSGAFSTAIPLQVNNYSNLDLRDAIHSVLALTLLHYGSVRSTRLPVSTHASDKIAGFLRRIGLNSVSGNVPFWL